MATDTTAGNTDVQTGVKLSVIIASGTRNSLLFARFPNSTCGQVAFFYGLCFQLLKFLLLLLLFLTECLIFLVQLLGLLLGLLLATFEA